MPLSQKRVVFSKFLLPLPGKQVLLLLLPLLCMQYKCSRHSRIHSINFIEIPYNEPDLNAPGRGAEQWYNDNIINIPYQNIRTPRLDKYWRFNWAGLNPHETVYDWSYFDDKINAAIDARQKFSFGIMSQYPWGNGSEGSVVFDGGTSAYPEWLHRQMQSEEIKDWIYSGDWIPDWNSEYYLKAWENFNIALNNHLQQASYKGIQYKNVINYIDIRGYGSWGEWHSYPWGGSESNEQQKATEESLIRIINATVNAYSGFQLVAMSDGFNSGGNANTPLTVTYYLLTATNKKGVFGWRRDNWGSPAPWYKDMLENNPNSYKGISFSYLIMNKWKYAPIVGEPLQADTKNGGPCEYWELKDQVLRYHTSSFGNGNLESTSNCAAGNIRAASKACGYRLILKGGDVKTESQLVISLDWQNIGVAPTYENWEVVYQLTDSSNTVIWNGISTFSPKLFIGEKTITDSFPMPILKNGTYNLSVIIKDPANYRQPLPLAIRGRNQDGSYTLTSINVPLASTKGS